MTAIFAMMLAAVATGMKAEDYFYVRPATNAIKGAVMGEGAAYRMVRYEDKAWLAEALAERRAFAGNAHWRTNDVPGRWLYPELKAGVMKLPIAPEGNEGYWNPKAQLSETCLDAVTNEGWTTLMKMSEGAMTNLLFEVVTNAPPGAVLLAPLTNAFAQMRSMKRLAFTANLERGSNMTVEVEQRWGDWENGYRGPGYNPTWTWDPWAISEEYDFCATNTHGMVSSGTFLWYKSDIKEKDTGLYIYGDMVTATSKVWKVKGETQRGNWVEERLIKGWNPEVRAWIEADTNVWTRGGTCEVEKGAGEVRGWAIVDLGIDAEKWTWETNGYISGVASSQIALDIGKPEEMAFSEKTNEANRLTFKWTLDGEATARRALALDREDWLAWTEVATPPVPATPEWVGERYECEDPYESVDRHDVGNENGASCTIDANVVSVILVIEPDFRTKLPGW